AAGIAARDARRARTSVRSRRSTVRATVRAAAADCQSAAARPPAPRRRSGHPRRRGRAPSSPRESAARLPDPDRTDSAGRRTADVGAQTPRPLLRVRTLRRLHHPHDRAEHLEASETVNGWRLALSEADDLAV